MLRLDVLGQVAGLPGGLEEFLEMLRLTHVGDVDDPVGLQLAHPVPDGCHVGGVVAVAAVRFADDQRRVETLDPQHQRPVVDDGDAALGQVGGHLRKGVVVGRLARQVRIGQQHPETLIGGVETGQGDRDQLPPDRQGLLVAALQLHDARAGAGGETGIVVEMFLGILVELLRAGKVEGGDVDSLLDDVLHQHPELGAPVADVVLRDHLVPQGGEDAVETVADDGGAQVPDVHLFGNVGRRVVDDDPLRVRCAAQPVVGILQHGGGGLREDVGTDPEVDEPRPGDLRGFAQVGDVEPCDYVRRDLPGGAFLLLREAQRHIGLEVSELGFRGRPHLRIHPRDGAQTGIEQGRQRLHGGHSLTLRRGW